MLPPDRVTTGSDSWTSSSNPRGRQAMSGANVHSNTANNSSTIRLRTLLGVVQDTLTSSSTSCLQGRRQG
jgi:hypothetical protein